jgi:hypothetical protein
MTTTTFEVGDLIETVWNQDSPGGLYGMAAGLIGQVVEHVWDGVSNLEEGEDPNEIVSFLILDNEDARMVGEYEEHDIGYAKSLDLYRSVSFCVDPGSARKINP